MTICAGTSDYADALGVYEEGEAELSLAGREWLKDWVQRNKVETSAYLENLSHRGGCQAGWATVLLVMEQRKGSDPQECAERSRQRDFTPALDFQEARQGIAGE